MKVVAEELRGTCYLLRVVEQEYGDPYTIALVADVADDGRSVELKGLDKPLTLAEGRAINEWINEMGFESLAKVRRGRRSEFRRTKEMTNDC